MKKTAAKKTLKALFVELAEKADVYRTKSEALYFVQVNQAIGVMIAAEALGVPLIPRDEQEFDHPDTLLPMKSALHGSVCNS